MMHSLGMGLFFLFIGLPTILVALLSVFTAFRPSRHPEEEERFGSRRRLERSLKDRRRISHR